MLRVDTGHIHNFSMTWNGGQSAPHRFVLHTLLVIAHVLACRATIKYLETSSIRFGGTSEAASHFGNFLDIARSNKNWQQGPLIEGRSFSLHKPV